MRWPPGTARGAAPPSARSSASCSRPRSSPPPRWARQWAGWAGICCVGLSRADVKELGDIIDDRQAALVIVGESRVEQAVDKAALKAEKHVAEELDVKPEGHRQGRRGSRHRKSP